MNKVQRRILRLYVRWLNHWGKVHFPKEPAAYKIASFADNPVGYVKVLCEAQGYIILSVYDGDDGGPATLVAELNEDGQVVNLVQIFDTYVSVIVNAYEYLDPRDKGLGS